MSLFEQYENEMRSRPLHGVTFTIDVIEEPEFDDRITYGESRSHMINGNMVNYQDVFLDGVRLENVELFEYVDHNIFKPMVTAYKLFLADCTEEHLVTDEMRSSRHFSDCGEWFEMSFATFQQLINYLKQTNAIC